MAGIVIDYGLNVEALGHCMAIRVRDGGAMFVCLFCDCFAVFNVL